MQKYVTGFLIVISLVFLTNCSRSVTETSKISIQTPQRDSQQAKVLYQNLGTLPSSQYKICYGVNVTGSGITNSPSSCGPTLGVKSPFVAEGSEVWVDVPRGDSRKVEVFAYISTNLTAPCPNWNPSCSVGQGCSTYKVGQVDGVSVQGDETRVDVAVSFPGFDNHVVATSSSPLACSGEVKSLLYSSGEVRSPSGDEVQIGLSHPANSSVYAIDGLLHSTFLGGVTSENSNYQLPLWLDSYTKDPGTGQLYAMTHGGDIVGVNPLTQAVTSYTLGTCPLVHCKVPVWFQSISVGLSAKLFGLDHGGNIWEVQSGGAVTKTSTSVPPYVKQVTFF